MPHASTAVVPDERRVRWPVAAAVTPELDRRATCRLVEQLVAARVLDAAERPDEDGAMAPPGTTQRVEHTGVEADAEVLRRDPELTEARHVVRKRGEDQVELLEVLPSGWLRGDLSNQESTPCTQRGERLGGQEAEVLNVDHIRLEPLGLADDELRVRPPAKPREQRPPDAVLGSPGGLERVGVHHQLVRVVPERPEVVRVGVGGTEERVHQRAPLAGVRLSLQVPRCARNGLRGTRDSTCRRSGFACERSEGCANRDGRTGCRRLEHGQRRVGDEQLLLDRYGSAPASERSVDERAQLRAVALVATALRRPGDAAEELEPLEVDEDAGRRRTRMPRPVPSRAARTRPSRMRSTRPSRSQSGASQGASRPRRQPKRPSAARRRGTSRDRRSARSRRGSGRLAPDLRASARARAARPRRESAEGAARPRRRAADARAARSGGCARRAGARRRRPRRPRRRRGRPGRSRAASRRRPPYPARRRGRRDLRVLRVRRRDDERIDARPTRRAPASRSTRPACRTGRRPTSRSHRSACTPRDADVVESGQSGQQRSARERAGTDEPDAKHTFHCRRGSCLARCAASRPTAHTRGACRARRIGRRASRTPGRPSPTANRCVTRSSTRSEPAREQIEHGLDVPRLRPADVTGRVVEAALLVVAVVPAGSVRARDDERQLLLVEDGDGRARARHRRRRRSAPGHAPTPRRAPPARSSASPRRRAPHPHRDRGSRRPTSASRSVGIGGVAEAAPPVVARIRADRAAA